MKYNNEVDTSSSCKHEQFYFDSSEIRTRDGELKELKEIKICRRCGERGLSYMKKPNPDAELLKIIIKELKLLNEKLQSCLEALWEIHKEQL